MCFKLVVVNVGHCAIVINIDHLCRVTRLAVKLLIREL